MEQTANNNPSSATAQNAFYSALLRANMPAIVVERYQTGRYATNAASQETYQRALERIGTGDAAVGSAGAAHLQGTSAHSSLSAGQLQAIGQAMAAHRTGGDVSVGSTSASAGAKKDSPLYVVVGESRGFTIFKWVKFVVSYGFLIWVTLIVVMVFVEMTGVLKKVGFSQFNEAQPQQQKARFSDVQGCDEAKEELQELVEFLKDPKKFSTLGGKLPKGILLVGPPGTGKTLLARAVAGEAGVPFFFMSGSEFDEVYVGVGAKRIRELFNAARTKAPAIVFIDELDAVGGKRNERDAAYVKQTLNQLLTELDGFTQETGVIIIGATNFPQLLDKALTRPGRFDRHVVVPLPDVRGRMEILQLHMKKIKAEVNVDPSTIARQTPGFSGAELENLVNQAAVRASRNKQKFVTLLDFDWAKDRILMGAERRSAVIQQKDRVMTAYHEGGHALVALFTEAADPVYKATIMPRGQALGMTTQLPEMDQVSMSKRQCLARIDVCMGGKVAEEMIYGLENTTTGASSVSVSPFSSHSICPAHGSPPPRLTCSQMLTVPLGHPTSYAHRPDDGHAGRLLRHAGRRRPRQRLQPAVGRHQDGGGARGAPHHRRQPGARAEDPHRAPRRARAPGHRARRVRGARPRGDQEGGQGREAGQDGRERAAGRRPGGRQRHERGPEGPHAAADQAAAVAGRDGTRRGPGREGGWWGPGATGGA